VVRAVFKVAATATDYSSLCLTHCMTVPYCGGRVPVTRCCWALVEGRETRQGAVQAVAACAGMLNLSLAAACSWLVFFASKVLLLVCYPCVGSPMVCSQRCAACGTLRVDKLLMRLTACAQPHVPCDKFWRPVYAMSRCLLIVCGSWMGSFAPWCCSAACLCGASMLHLVVEDPGFLA
jgi:hypothetical protein